MVVGVGVLRANAIPTEPTDNPCVSNSSGTVSVSPSSLSLGQSTTVSTSFHNAAGCVLVPYLVFQDGASGRQFDVSGSVVTPPASGRYLLKVAVPGASYVMAGASVTVGLPVVNGRPLASITSGGEQSALFAQGVSTPNAVVTIRGDVDLDLSYQNTLVVAPGVQIIGQRDAAHPAGPRLFTTTFQTPVLSVGADAPSDNVRITGIRFDGGESSDPCDEAGFPHEDIIGVDVLSSQNVEIDHNEFYHWSGQATQVDDPGGRINRDNSHTVWIHDNYIHDNQHPTECVWTDGTGHGAGYGVSANNGGFPTIEHNVFSDNRHAVSAGWVEGDGYVLVGNLFLRPGIDSAKFVIPSYNHHIDVHGRDSDCAGWFNFESYACGPAGEYFEVSQNTVVGFDQPGGGPGDAIQLRGTPTSYAADTGAGGMRVQGNVFAQSRGRALTQTEVGLVDAGQNVFGANLLSFWDSGNAPCDFDGDVVNDPFRASGASWWYYSSRAHRWVALETTPSTSVTFSDVNHDGLCDATSGWTRLTQPLFESFPSLVTTVPNLIGSTVGAATTTLLSVGLAPGTVTSAANLAPVGTIISTSPAAGPARIGSPVSIVVSSGGVVVPNVLGGIDEGRATSAIRAAGLELGTVSRHNDPSIRAGKVMSQSPAAGAVVAPDTRVNISVSLGPEPGTDPDPGGGGSDGGGEGCFIPCG